MLQPIGAPECRVGSASAQPGSGRPGGALVLLFVLLAALGLAFCQFVRPGITPASASRTEFSAARTMADLHVIAQAPRPLGSPGNTSTSDYLIAQHRALGLDPQVQTANVAGRFPDAPAFNAAYVPNVMTRLPGIASSGAILHDSHYDGGNTGPASSDCGFCVVRLVETLRVIKAGPPLKNDASWSLRMARRTGTWARGLSPMGELRRAAARSAPVPRRQRQQTDGRLLWPTGRRDRVAPAGPIDRADHNPAAGLVGWPARAARVHIPAPLGRVYAGPGGPV